MSKLKTRLEYNNKNNKYIESLKKVYLIGHWARYGVLEFPYAGKMVEDDLFGMTPLVYDLDDHNGTYAEYILTKINDVTTGDIIIYTFNRNLAQTLSDRLNEYKSCQIKNCMKNSIETSKAENKELRQTKEGVYEDACKVTESCSKERLAELEEQIKILEEHKEIADNTIEMYAEKCKKHEEQLANAIVPKFKVGQDLYTIDEFDYSIVPFEIDKILITENGIEIKSVEWDEWFTEDEFFITREEAEQKLVEIKGEKDE